MDIGKGNIIRSICRSLEVLLFFVISIVGFNVLVKTTSLNSKSKTKPQFGGLLAPRELSAAESDTALRSALERIDCFLSSEHNISSSSFTIHSGTPPFPDVMHHRHLPITQRGSDENNNVISIASPLRYREMPVMHNIREWGCP